MQETNTMSDTTGSDEYHPTYVKLLSGVMLLLPVAVLTSPENYGIYPWLNERAGSDSS